MEFHVANYTKEPPVVKNTAIIGMSNTNAHTDTTNYTAKMSAIITGKSGTWKITQVRFYNYPVGSILIQTCNRCDDPT